MSSPFSVSLNEVVVALGTLLDLANPSLSGHHKRVAYMSGMIGGELGLEPEKLNTTVLAASLHDIGAISGDFQTEVLEFEADISFAQANDHAEKSFCLLAAFSPLREAAAVVRRHHFVWSDDQAAIGRGEQIAHEPIETQIVHLADRVDVLLRNTPNILDGVGDVRRKVAHHAGGMFDRRVADAFLAISAREGFWYRIQSKSLDDSLRRLMGETTHLLDGSQMLDLARLFATIVDSRSRFTAAHSTAVAAVAGTLGELAGFSGDDTLLLRIAGYLHDIGKLAVPRSLLDKNGPLTDDEMLVMRVHPYYTFDILDRVRGFRKIRDCAACHHERLDGSGYPFRFRGDSLGELARVVQIADIFTALAEDRPYRRGMAKVEVIEALEQMKSLGQLDSTFVEIACAEYDELEQTCFDAHNGPHSAGERLCPSA